MGLIMNRRIVSGYFFIFLITIALRGMGFSLIADEIRILTYAFFLLLTIVVGIHFLKRKLLFKTDVVMILCLSFITLFLFRDTVLLAMLITLMVFLIFVVGIKKYEGEKAFKIIALVISSCFLLVSILVSVVMLTFGSFFPDFIGTVEIKTVPSPNGNYRLVVEEVDQGALGGNTLVNVKRSILGIVEWKKRIYIGRWGEQPNMEWIGNYEISINGEHKNIFYGTTIDKR